MFTEILGQEKAISHLQNLVRTRRMPGALLFYGPDGVGKRKTALAFAQALNCEHPQDAQACGMCANCLAAQKGTHPNITLVDFVFQARGTLKTEPSDPDYEEELEKEITKQQHLSVETIRNATALSQQKAVGNGWKVLIIDQAQTMQRTAANALLKFIEEPPAKTVWILITNKRAAMLPTILSRCQPLAFAPLSQAQVVQILQTAGADVADPERCARYSGGSVSRALKAAHALELLESAGFGTPQGPCQVVAELSRTLAQARQEAQAVLDVLREALHNGWIAAPEEDRAAWQGALNKFEQYKKNIGQNVSPALVLETALMSLDGLNVKL